MRNIFLLRNVLRRRNLLIAGVLVLTGLSAIAVLQLPRRFTAEAVILVDARKNRIAEGSAVFSPLPTDIGAIKSEVEVLQLPALALRVVRDRNLISDPEFQREISTPTRLERLEGRLGEALGSAPAVWLSQQLGLESLQPMLQPPARTREALEMKASRYLLENLSVYNDPRSYTIHVRYRSLDPRRSAMVANAMAAAYLAQQIEARYAALDQTNSWLSQRLEELRRKAVDADNAVETYRNAHHLQDSDAAEQESSEVDTELTQARAAVATARARYEEARRLATTRAGLDTSEIVSNSLIQRLREHESTLRRRIADASSHLGDQHPTIISLRAELAALDAKIWEEVNRIVDSLRSTMLSAEAHESAAAARLKSVQTRVSELRQAEVGLHALQHEAEVDRKLYADFLIRYNQAQAGATFQQPDARIVSNALVPTEPSDPRLSMLLLFGFGGSTIVVFGGAILLEYMRGRLQSIEQAEHALGIKGVGLLPAIGREKLAAVPSVRSMDGEQTLFMEALLSIRTGLSLMRRRGGSCQVVVVTSCFAGEGKTTVSTALARSAQLAGKRTLLMEADLRRPQLDAIFGAARANDGIADLGIGETKISDVIQIEAETGLRFVSAGRRRRDAPAILERLMRRAVTELRRHFDLIVIDTPPLMAVSDALLVTPEADLVLMVTKWNDTPGTAVRSALQMLTDSSSTPVSFVLSQVQLEHLLPYEKGRYSGAYAVNAA